jgi:hypothetical protein
MTNAIEQANFERECREIKIAQEAAEKLCRQLMLEHPDLPASAISVGFINAAARFWAGNYPTDALTLFLRNAAFEIDRGLLDHLGPAARKEFGNA